MAKFFRKQARQTTVDNNGWTGQGMDGNGYISVAVVVRVVAFFAGLLFG